MRLLAFLLSVSVASAALQVGFYSSTCPRAESVVQGAVQKHFRTDPSITAALLRMHFHDCWNTGCDASILINSTKNNPSEKDADENQTVRGFDIIDVAKSILETECPSTVSCADIIALATRDAVTLASGLKYSIPTGRRDGTESNPDNVHIPSPSAGIANAIQLFRAKGFSVQDMVVLLGAHTVGKAHCGFFADRLSDFRGSGKPDPTMNSTLRTRLVKLCSAQNAGVSEPSAFLDQGTSFKVDNVFYNQIAQHKGILQIDQELALDNSAARIVAGLRKDNGEFLRKFAAAMVKLGNTEVLEGKAGEIRKQCSEFNALPK